MKTQTSYEQDKLTLEAIGRIYCKAHHSTAEKDTAGLCAECRETINNALARTERCPYGHSGNCQDCDIKCNRGEQQIRIKEIMRYAAPRMFVTHPVMAANYVRKKLRSKRKK